MHRINPPGKRSRSSREFANFRVARIDPGAIVIFEPGPELAPSSLIGNLSL
jgi:hypothetical protein